MTELIAPALRQLAHSQRAIHRDAHCAFKESLGRDARPDYGHEINCVGVHRPRWLSLRGFDGLEAFARAFYPRQCQWHTLLRNCVIVVLRLRRRCFARWHDVSTSVGAGRGAH